MGRNEGQVELMQRQNAEPSRARVVRRISKLPWRHLRLGAMLCIGLIGVAGFVRAQALSPPPPAPTVVSIDASKPLSEALQYGLAGKEPHETRFEFNGNGRDWSFVYFDKLPKNTSIKTKDQLAGYSDSEVIQEEKWYWFKTKLPLTLSIKAGAQPPVNISFWFGSPSRDADKEQAKPMNAEQMRQFIDHHEFKKDTEKQSFGFTWAASDPSATSSASPTPSMPRLIPISPPEVSWLTYLTTDAPEFGLLVLIISLIVLVVFIMYGVPKILRSIQRLKRSISKSSHGHNHPRSSPVDSLSISGPTNAEEIKTSQVREESKYPSTVYIRGKDETDNYEWPQEEQPRKLQPGDVVLPPPKASPATSFKQQIPSGRADGNRLEQMIKDEVARLRTTLEEKASRQEQVKLLADARLEVEAKLAGAEGKLAQRVSTIVEELETMVVDQASLMEKTRGEVNNQVSQIAEREAQVKLQLEGLLKEVLQEVRNVDTRLQARLAELQTAQDRRTVPDSFYARTLGVVLGQHIEALQDGNFEKLMGEQLNQFFQADVAHGEELQEVRARADRINAALKEVSLQMSKLNPQAANETRPQMQKVEALLTELIGLQAQLQTRRATVETTLRIPVSTYAGARQTFLDELGRGIRREIEKLKDPENYFESELSRLVTTDVISIVDICDKKIATVPGTRPELEGALKKLFEEAGLRSILPRSGDPFKTAEQDLIEMDKGAGPSMTVAHVIIRGFYYKHRDNETLLRKAGVTVFR